MLKTLTCRLCGGELVQEKNDTYKCLHCGKVYNKSLEDGYESALKSIIDVTKLEHISAARQNLWREMHEEYVNSTSCVAYARELKGLIPEDYYANFAEAANIKNEAEVARFLNESTEDNMKIYADAVLDFMLKSLTGRTLVAVSLYIERAYAKDDPTYKKYIDWYEEEAKKVDSGVYEPSIGRDVFLAYSSKDMGKVVELCDYLEGKGIQCFFSMRNLRHGRDAANNYDAYLREALDNCRVVVFVSSKNSRNISSCDALKKELPYMRDRDKVNAPEEYRNKPYDKIPEKYKKPRMEYILDAHEEKKLDNPVKEYFDGLNWCLTKEDVYKRVEEYITAVPDEYIKKSFHICGNCGIEFVGKFCPRCGTKYDESASDITFSSVDKENKGIHKVVSSLRSGEDGEKRICKKCGAVVMDNFCPVCGTKCESAQGICKKCGAVMKNGYCPVCGLEDGAQNICRNCGKTFAGKFCPGCGEKYRFYRYGRVLYKGISRLIPIMFFVFAVLVVIACTAMPRANASDGELLEKNTIMSFHSSYSWGQNRYLRVFCFVNLGLATIMSIWSLLQSSRKIGKISLYQMVGIISIISMGLTLLGGCFVWNNIINDNYKRDVFHHIDLTPAAGVTCVLVFTIVCIALTLMCLIMSGVFTRHNPMYENALSEERVRLHVPKQ